MCGAAEVLDLVIFRSLFLGRSNTKKHKVKHKASQRQTGKQEVKHKASQTQGATCLQTAGQPVSRVPLGSVTD